MKMKKTILGLFGMFVMATLSNAQPPHGWKGIVTWAANYRELLYTDENNVETWANRAWQTVYYTAVGPNEPFYLTSLMGEDRQLNAITRAKATPYYYDYYDSTDLWTKYDRFFCTGATMDAVQPDDCGIFLSVYYKADWAYYAVYNQLAYVYGLPFAPDYWAIRMTEHWEDTVWFTE